MILIDKLNPSYTELIKFMSERNLLTANEVRTVLGLEKVTDGDLPVNTYAQKVSNGPSRH